jgi:hypothetical protein
MRFQEVDSYNISQLIGLKTESILYEAVHFGADYYVKQLDQGLKVPKTLEIKIGSQAYSLAVIMTVTFQLYIHYY